ncbi:hypothetical protein MKX01_012981 [Papaver californicum]|nr:hypothetical protein MKX01_012981 [Papaver californicum]
MLDELNLRLPSFGDDPFADEDNNFSSGRRAAAKSKGAYVHLRIHKRKGKKCLTTVEGLNPELDYENILKEFKKGFCCNGNVTQDKEFGNVIQLQGVIKGGTCLIPLSRLVLLIKRVSRSTVIRLVMAV